MDRQHSTGYKKSESEKVIADRVETYLCRGADVISIRRVKEKEKDGAA